MARGNRKVEEFAREERRKTVAANMLAGLSAGEIAVALGVAKSTVYNDLRCLLQRWHEDQVALIGTQRLLDVRRCDRLLNTLWGEAQEGKLRVIDRVLRLLERRARLLGLDAPAKVAPTTPDGDKPWDPETAVTEAFASDVAEVLAEFGLLRLHATPNGTTAEE